MTSEVFGIDYHRRSREKYEAIRAEREVALGNTKSFCDRVSSKEGKTDPISKESTPIRALQTPPVTALPVGSRRSDKAPTVDVKGKIADHKALKGARRSGGRRK